MTYNDYRKMAISDLTGFNERKQRTLNLQKRIDFLRSNSLYLSPQFGENIQFSRDSDSAMVNLTSQLEDLESKLKFNRIYCASIEETLKQLSPDERDILSRFYIDRRRNSLVKMSLELYAHQTTVYRHAQKALARYIEIHYGVIRDDYSYEDFCG